MQLEEKQFDLYFSGEMSQPEKDIFLKKISGEPELKKEFIRIQNIKGISCLHNIEGDDQTAMDGWIKFNKVLQRRSFKRLSFNVVKYAAAIAVLVISTFFLKEYFFSSEAIAYNEVEVPVGESLHLTLSDGTTVNLSPRSKFRYPDSFGREERCVILDGEAFFDVKKNPDKPFIVQTNRYNVKVLGTKFNVFDYMSSVIYETSLYEGSIEVYKKDDKETNSVILVPNEQVVLKDNMLIKSVMDSNDVTMKENGIVVFESRSFKEIIKKLELYYNMNFIITNMSALDKIYTGKFRIQDPIEDVLGAIQKTNKFKYAISSDNKIVYIM